MVDLISSYVGRLRLKTCSKLDLTFSVAEAIGPTYLYTYLYLPGFLLGFAVSTRLERGSTYQRVHISCITCLALPIKKTICSRVYVETQTCNHLYLCFFRVRHSVLLT